MERVWIISEELYAQRDAMPANRMAEIHYVRDLAQLKKSVGLGERPVILADYAVLKRSEDLPKPLAIGLLPKPINQERLIFAIRSVLNEARLQHDLDAAETVAWSGGSGGQFDDPSIEFLGTSILEISGARSTEAVEAAILKACERIAPVKEVRILSYPETASARVIGLYQLAIPVQFQGELKAHIYIRFDLHPEQSVMDKVSEALFNLSDAIALAVERNRMINKAEETKTVWEASFDAVEDPVVILDKNFQIIRGNRAYGKFSHIPLPKLLGKELAPEILQVIQKLPADKPSETDVESAGRHFRAFFDPIGEPLGAGRYVLRFHDVTEERTLTEKILAKEQVAELGVLVGSVAHEINNPIGGILAIGQILLKDVEKGSPLATDIENIVHSAERCKKIIQTMLSLVRKSDEEKKFVDVAEAIQAALDLLGSEAKRLQVSIKFQPKNAKTLGNRNRLLQVFFHLLQQSLLAIADRREKTAPAYLRIQMIPGFGNLEVQIEDNGDSVKHEYEIQGSIAFTVSKMILEEHEIAYTFSKSEGKNLQRLIFSSPTSNVS